MTPVASPAHSLVGSTLTGTNGLKVKIERKIGSGTFGVVYLATQGRGKLSKQYAVKVIAPITDTDVQLSFENEIRAASELQSDHLLLPLDHGECDVHGERGFFIISRYCADGSFRERGATRTAPVSAEEFEKVISEFEQILHGLSVLHTKTVHRDLKPENILVDGDTLLIGDFGLTKLVNDATRTLTFKGSGTPLYMAPEVWGLKHIGIPADLYAVGVMLFEAVTGKPPFVGDAHELQDMHLYKAAPRVRSLNPHVPIGLDGVIKKLLSKEPQHRYTSADELLQALRAPVPSTPPVDAVDFVQSMQRHRDAEELKRLEREREQRSQNDAAARNAYMEEEALTLFEDAIAEINAQTPDAQMRVTRNGNELSCTFANRRLQVAFFSPHEFPADERGSDSRGYAERIRQQNVAHAGQIAVLENSQPLIGWNLVLVKNPQSEYGNWRFVEVHMSALTGKGFINGSIPADGAMLTRAYSNHIGHVMDIYNVKDKPFSKEDVQMTLRYLLPTTKLNTPEQERSRRRGLSDDYFDTY